MPGRPYLQIPGPTLVPERIVRAMSQPVIDHRGPKFAALVEACLGGLRRVFQTRQGHVVLYPGSGTGAWGAAIVNTPSPGGRGPAGVNGRLPPPQPTAPGRRAVLVPHNEPSTGVTSNVAAVRAALDRAGHPALLLVDTVSSLASIDFRFDAWGVDVALTGPQKGLMLPPGLAILAVSARALAASEKARCPRAYWDWRPVLERNRRGEFPYTPATVLLFGLEGALRVLEG